MDLVILTGPPQVSLRSASRKPYDGAIAAARTCYSPRVIAADEVTAAQRESIGPLTFEGGHHTVYQHAHFEFGLENVSRQFVWSFLHSHPFYNSEQSSQRFVRLDEVRALVPEGLGTEARAVYEAAVLGAWSAYRRLNDLLRPDTLRIMSELRHLSPNAAEKRKKRVAREAEKKAIETARYVIPARRLHLDGPHRLGHRAAPALADDAHRRLPARERGGGDGHGRPGARPRPRVLRARGRGTAGRGRGGGDSPAPRDLGLRRRGRAASTRRMGRLTSLLVDYTARGEETTADAVRALLGQTKEALPDDVALERALNPSLNRYRLETLNLAVHSPLSRALHHSTYTFLKKLSHTADSQDQRHRMVPGSRPLMTFTDTTRPDYITPPLVAANAAAQAVYAEAMDAAWTAKNRLLELGVPLELALYVLPNAKALRFHETGSLVYLGHKWVMRTCFNAQEEIYRASMDELDQVRAVHPGSPATWALPACSARAASPPPAPRASTSAACPCGEASPRSSDRFERSLRPPCCADGEGRACRRGSGGPRTSRRSPREPCSRAGSAAPTATRRCRPPAGPSPRTPPSPTGSWPSIPRPASCARRPGSRCSS